MSSPDPDPMNLHKQRNEPSGKIANGYKDILFIETYITIIKEK